MSEAISFEENKRPIWLLDRRTALFMINSIQKGTCEGGWYYEECPRCGASYIEDIGHKCSDTLRIKCDMPNIKEEKIEKSNMVDFVNYLSNSNHANEGKEQTE